MNEHAGQTSLGPDIRCSHCNKLLAKVDMKEGALVIKCLRCGMYNSIFRGINDPVIITDPDGTILFANAALEEVTGYTLEEALGKRPSLWGGQMPEEFYRRMWHRIKEEKKPFRELVTNRRKDGSLFEVALRISPIFDAQGDIRMMVAIETVTKENVPAEAKAY